MSCVPTPLGLRAGSVIEFADITELPSFEDQIAAEIDPEMTAGQADVWAGRIAIQDLIRPSKFNGRIADVALHVLDNPYVRLVTAQDRGVTFTKRGGVGGGLTRLKIEDAQNRKPLYRGFLFTANAYSSGKGVIGQIQSELYYCPPAFRRDRRTQKNTSGRSGATILRIVSKPNLSSYEAFISLDETSKRIAYEVVSNSLRNPLPQPFRS